MITVEANHLPTSIRMFDSHMIASTVPFPETILITIHYDIQALPRGSVMQGANILGEVIR